MPSIPTAWSLHFHSSFKMFFDKNWSGNEGVRNLLPSMASLTILTASATLLGPEVRQHLFKEVSELYVHVTYMFVSS